MSLDLKSYVPMHLGVIFGSLTLVTGSIWANIAWGTWWFWGDTQLTTFLIIFLFNCAYFMLRFSVEPGERRATFSAVYAVLGVGLIPLSVIGVHVAQTNDLIHPITFNENGANMDASMFLTFLVALAAMITLSVTMYLIELRGKRIDDPCAPSAGWPGARRDRRVRGQIGGRRVRAGLGRDAGLHRHPQRQAGADGAAAGRDRGADGAQGG
jgi:hypothetical protein